MLDHLNHEEMVIVLQDQFLKMLHPGLLLLQLDLDTSSSSSTELEISSTESEPTPVSEPEHSSEDPSNRTNIDGRDGNLSASTDEDEDTSESDTEMDAWLETATGLRV